MKLLKALTMCGLMCLAFNGKAQEAHAQEKTQWRLGLGGYWSLNVPFMGLRDRVTDTGKVGGTLSYVMSSSTILELEGYYAKFNNGKLEDLEFVWPVDGNSYSSPQALSEMTLKSAIVNLLVHPPSGHAFTRGGISPYFAFGVGFYDYDFYNENLVFGAQTTPPLDTTLVLHPFSDTRTALSFNLGLGAQAFIIENWALDVRARYNMVIGELREVVQYNIGHTFPIQLFDMSAGIKFYFK